MAKRKEEIKRFWATLIFRDDNEPVVMVAKELGISEWKLGMKKLPHAFIEGPEQF